MPSNFHILLQRNSLLNERENKKENGGEMKGTEEETSSSKVLGEIVEREDDSCWVPPPTASTFPVGVLERGFPQFQQQAVIPSTKTTTTTTTVAPQRVIDAPRRRGKGKGPIDEDERREIERENREKISSMSGSDVSAALHEIRSSVPSELIEKLRARGRKRVFTEIGRAHV